MRLLLALLQFLLIFDLYALYGGSSYGQYRPLSDNESTIYSSYDRNSYDRYSRSANNSWESDSFYSSSSRYNSNSSLEDLIHDYDFLGYKIYRLLNDDNCLISNESKTEIDKLFGLNKKLLETIEHIKGNQKYESLYIKKGDDSDEDYANSKTYDDVNNDQNQAASEESGENQPNVGEADSSNDSKTEEKTDSETEGNGGEEGKDDEEEEGENESTPPASNIQNNPTQIPGLNAIPIDSDAIQISDDVTNQSRGFYDNSDAVEDRYFGKLREAKDIFVGDLSDDQISYGMEENAYGFNQGYVSDGTSDGFYSPGIDENMSDTVDESQNYNDSFDGNYANNSWENFDQENVNVGEESERLSDSINDESFGNEVSDQQNDSQQVDHENQSEDLDNSSAQEEFENEDLAEGEDQEEPEKFARKKTKRNHNKNNKINNENSEEEGEDEFYDKDKNESINSNRSKSRRSRKEAKNFQKEILSTEDVYEEGALNNESIKMLSSFVGADGFQYVTDMQDSFDGATTANRDENNDGRVHMNDF